MFHQITCHRRETIELTIGPVVFNGHVPCLDIARLAQTLSERRDQMRIGGDRSAAEEPNYGHRRLLRVRGERPKRSRASNDFDKIAASHCLPRGSAPTMADYIRDLRPAK
jgi:hypothetical protein